jgi:quinol monooxygenase YgiN
MSKDSGNRYVRIAELEIDPTQVDALVAATREVGQDSVRNEAGCLALYAVAEKDNPAHVRVFEIYRDAAAYETHLQTAHFRKFRATTDAIVRARKLFEANLVSLATKPGALP